MGHQTVIVSRTPTQVMSLADAKRELDITFDNDDILVQQHLDSGINFIETFTNRLLMPTVVDLYLDKLPLSGPLWLPHEPITAFTSLTVDGVAVSGIQAIGGSPYALMPAANTLWPYTANGLGSIVARYSAGYAAGQVPAGILAALRAILNIYYDKPTGPELNAQWEGVKNALSTFRVRNI